MPTCDLCDLCGLCDLCDLCGIDRFAAPDALWDDLRLPSARGAARVAC